MRIYNIAGLRIGFDGYTDDVFNERIHPYEDDAAESVDVRINIEMTDTAMPLPDNNIVCAVGGEVWRSQNEGKNLLHYLLFPDLDGAAVCTEYNENFDDITVTMYDTKRCLGCDDKAYLINTLSMVMHYVAMMHGRLVLHSSAICCDGVGVAFSADSGVGKSTHTALWQKYIPGTEYINDDTPMISVRDGNVFISGTPFAGSSGINNNQTVPLGAIFFIERAKENSAVRLPTPIAFSRMMGQLRSPVNGAMTDSMIKTVDAVMKKVPVYTLRCNMEADAAYTAKKISDELAKGNMKS